MTPPPCLTPSGALALAQSLFRSRYAGADFAFVAGSIMRGQGTFLSDIDLVVVYDNLTAARRESLLFQHTPVEAFVHDEATLAWFLDADVARGQPGILDMIAQGTIIGPAVDRATRWQQDAARRMALGPPALSTEAIHELRYEITDALDDLMGQRSAAEVMAIGAALHPRLVELALRGRGHWNGAGKWAPRQLTAVDAALAEAFDHAFRALFVAGATGPLIALAETELAPHGGRLFDGDCRIAPESWRV